jgi:hypothetical protein
MKNWSMILLEEIRWHMRQWKKTHWCCRPCHHKGCWYRGRNCPRSWWNQYLRKSVPQKKLLPPIRDVISKAYDGQWRRRRSRVPPTHQSSNPGFDTCVSHKYDIFIQWEATFPSTPRRLWWLHQFQYPIRRLSLPQVLIEVWCACVHS